MNLLKKIIIAVLVVVLMTAVGFYAGSQEKEVVVAVDNSAAELEKIRQHEEKKVVLGQFVLDQMQEVNAQLSPLKRQVLARIVSSVVTEIFDREDHQKAFIAVLAIESGFNKFAQSPTGPRGMSQMAKSAFKEGMDMCAGIAYNDEDVWDESVNVLGGACYFKKILERTKGDVFAAIVAYNQGMNSDAFKAYQKNGGMKNPEALSYMARFVYLTKPKISGSEIVKTEEVVSTGVLPEATLKSKKK